MVQTLVRKDLLTEDHQTVTLAGKELLAFVETKHTEKLKRVNEHSQEFDRWWAEYPPTDGFSYKNRDFKPTRSLRQAKESCKQKFFKIIEKGKYSVDDLIAALKLDIQMKKDESVSTGTNKLKYMQNSLTYLNQESFEAFVELAKTIKPKEEPKIKGGVDI